MTYLKNREYKVVDTIDKGGFGEVFKAYKIQSHSSNQDVAIKKSKIPTGDEKRKIPDPRIEALILKDLCKMQDARQVIVEYYDSFTEDGFHYLVMEYCPYGSIYEYLLKERRNPYTEDHTRDILLDVLTALDYIHNAGYIHRDLTPKNILIHNFTRDSIPKVKLVDFGLSKKIQHIRDTVAGTPGFFDVQMMRDGRSKDVDYYALGCVMFFMLTSELISTRENKLTPKEVERKLKARSISDEAVQLVLYLTSKRNIENSFAIKMNSFFTKEALKAAQIHVSTIRQSIAQSEREPLKEIQNKPSEQRERPDWYKPQLKQRQAAPSHAYSLPTKLTARQSKLSVASSNSPSPWPLPSEFRQIVKNVMVNGFGRALLFGHRGKFICETLDGDKRCTYVGHLTNACDADQELMIYKPVRKFELFNFDVHPEGIPMDDLRLINRIKRPIDLEGNKCAKTMYSRMRSILKVVAEKPCRTWENPNLVPNSFAKLTWGGTIIVDLPNKQSIRWTSRAQGPPLREYPELNSEFSNMLKDVHSAFTFNRSRLSACLPQRRP